MQVLLGELTDDQWNQSVVLDGHPHTVGWFARHVLHDGLHHMGDIGRIRQRLGHGATTHVGSVAGLHTSDGGVPKRPIAAATMGAHGLEGDTQANRRHHGRPFQAVSLWSAQVIEHLRADGHPIHPGAAGENITVAGVDWATLLPGSRIDVGAVPLLITAMPSRARRTPSGSATGTSGVSTTNATPAPAASTPSH